MQTMNILKEEKGEVMIGSGLLYAQLASEFDCTNFNLTDMTEMGYIQDNAVFNREREYKDIETANYGTVDTIGGKTTTTFNTNIISYNAQNVAKFMTGAKVIDNNGKRITYYVTGAKVPTIALVFVGTDEDSGKEFMLVMPKCKWNSNLTLDFNNENPVALDFAYKCLTTTLGTYIDEDDNNTEKPLIGEAFTVEKIDTTQTTQTTQTTETSQSGEG